MIAPNTPSSEHRHQAVLDFHDQGLSGAEIGKHLGISRQAVSKILIANGIYSRSKANLISDEEALSIWVECMGDEDWGEAWRIVGGRRYK